jgi:NAD(P)-dependent dehydrogenase (short-subunit alcohol dehydrogenase family)
MVWVSSGAANMSLVAWGTYSSSKAAVNAIVAHYAVEEPDVSSIAINPGRVDTDMQATIRDQGKASMNQSQHENFVDAFETGGLLKPEQPGSVIARLAVKPAKELSGRFLRYVASKLQCRYCLLTRQQLGLT